jgi:cysteine desulfurase/selenocysteine lyase
MPVNVNKIDCDFMTFSGHKMLGPTGTGVLYATKEKLDQMRPFMAGGDMIEDVDMKKIEYADLPWKFEAGTANVADAVGLSAAMDYLRKIGMESVHDHEKMLTQYAMKKLSAMKSMKIYGPQANRIGIIPFNMSRLSPHDVAILMDEQGIAVRSGYLCAQPFVQALSKGGIVRASFYIYNTKQEIDKFVEVLRQISV